MPRGRSKSGKSLGSSTVQVEVSTCTCEEFCFCPVTSPQVEVRRCEVALKKRKCNDEESRMLRAEMMVKRVDDELMAKKSKFDELCNEKTVVAEEITIEEELLNSEIEEMYKCKKNHHQKMDLLKLRKKGAEEVYNQRGKQVENIDSEIAALKAELNKAEEAKLELVHKQDLCENLIREVNSERSKLKHSIEKQQFAADKEVGKKKVIIDKLKLRLSDVLAGIENLPNDSFILPSEADISDRPYRVLREFIEKEIAAKEKELECPICMEVAASPILTCSDQHLICSPCRAKTEHCPVCSRSYHGKMRRHRYAEQALEEVGRLKRELEEQE